MYLTVQSYTYGSNYVVHDRILDEFLLNYQYLNNAILCRQVAIRLIFR